ncbi:MAG: TerB family tellurite resistance protein [Alphaproteobacteria bacterium]
MVGTKILGGGVAILIFGLALVGAHSLQIIAHPFVFAGGIISAIIGVVLMITGFVTLAGSEYMPKTGIRSGDQNAFSIALLRCMLAISIADDVLDDDEITELQKVYKHLTKNEIGTDIIRDTAQHMMEQDTSIQTELSTMVGTLDKASKDKLIIASLYILAADGDMDERELIMLDEIRLGLKMSVGAVEKIKKDFLSKRELTVS